MERPVEWDEHGRMRWGCPACGIKEGWYREDYADEHYRLYHQGARHAWDQGIGGYGGAGEGQGGGGNGGGHHAGAANVQPGARGGGATADGTPRGTKW